jgi:hypothetical protein
VYWHDSRVVEETHQLIPGRLGLKEIRCYRRYGVIQLAGGRENRSQVERLADLLFVLTRPDGSQLQGWVTVCQDNLDELKEINRAVRRELQFWNIQPLTSKGWRQMVAAAIEQGGSR